MKKLKNLNLSRRLKLDKLKNPAVVLIIIGIFTGLNLLLLPVSVRLDMSQGKAYTLSPSSAKIVRNLDKNLDMAFYVSSDLPNRLQPLKNDVVDILNEYKKSGYRVTVKILDPKKDESAAKEAQSAGIPELQFSQLEKDKYAITTAYFGIDLKYANKNEAIPQVTDSENLEYNLTSAIYKLTRKELPQIGIVADLKPSGGDDLSFFRQAAGQQFSVADISGGLLNEETIGSKSATLVIIDNNSKSYSTEEISALKKYLDKGGKAVFMFDGIWVGQDLSAATAAHNLFGLFRSYGLDLQKDLVLSASAELVNFGNGNTQFPTFYPFWIKTNVFNPQLSYFSGVGQISYPWASSINLNIGDSAVRPLVQTVPASWAQSGTFTLNPQEIKEPAQNQLKQYVLGAEYRKNATGFTLIPSSRFIQNNYLNRTNNNLEFILNILSNYASGGALTGIRSRVVNYYPLPVLSETQKDIFRYGNIIMLPLLFAFFGAVRLARRK